MLHFEHSAAIPYLNGGTLCEHLRRQFLKMPVLEEFEVEMDAPVAERAELNSVMARVEKPRIRIAETRELVAARRSEALERMREAGWPMRLGPKYQHRLRYGRWETLEVVKEKFCMQSVKWLVENAKIQSVRRR